MSMMVGAGWGVQERSFKYSLDCSVSAKTSFRIKTYRKKEPLMRRKTRAACLPHDHSHLGAQETAFSITKASSNQTKEDSCKAAESFSNLIAWTRKVPHDHRHEACRGHHWKIGRVFIRKNGKGPAVP